MVYIIICVGPFIINFLPAVLHNIALFEALQPLLRINKTYSVFYFILFSSPLTGNNDYKVFIVKKMTSDDG
jgi:hypothetical protein